MTATAASNARYVDRSLAEYSDDDRQLTGEAVAFDARPATFVLRGAGLAIDVLAGYALLLGLLLALSAAGSVLDQSATAAIQVTIIVVVFLLVPTLVETLSHGRSLGKLAIGARIVRDDGGAEQLRHAFVRSLAGVIEVYLTFGGIAAITGLLSPRSRRLGDLLAGTYSQLQRMPPTPPAPRPLPEHLAAWATVADVAALPPRLSRRIAEFLRHAQTLVPDARLRVATDLAREAAPFVAPLPNTDAETFLVAVAALRRDREYAALIGQERRLASVQGALSALPPGFPQR
ncbi:RDD family protein [Humibacter ginsenosidimutans]|uniref:RDD family protein n=1 Tax=Humibacter ginsenosidimutans TaxID=2599293 RepID=A0A5B8MAB6_9MICO|nr:RDD family protein [Humibacter ginsenosidimutans]QDZ16460.1 RDD family protein [Humibacter ginsenosidimutans]